MTPEECEELAKLLDEWGRVGIATEGMRERFRAAAARIMATARFEAYRAFVRQYRGNETDDNDGCPCASCKVANDAFAALAAEPKETIDSTEQS